MEGRSDLPEQVTIIKTVGSGGVDFNDLPAKSKRSKLALQKLLFVVFEPLQILMAGMPFFRCCPRKKALQQYLAICPAQNLKWLEIVQVLQMEQLGSS